MNEEFFGKRDDLVQAPGPSFEHLIKMKQELEHDLQQRIQRFSAESGLIVTYVDCNYDVIGGRALYEVEVQASLV